MRERRKRSGPPSFGKAGTDAAALSPGKRTRVQALARDTKARKATPDPQPADGEEDLDATRPIGDNVPAETRAELLAEVRKSPRVRVLLDEIEEGGGESFSLKWSGRGNFHSRGEIHIDRNRDFNRWIPSLIHELSHLADHLHGSEPEAATTESREEFVNGKMENEIRAQAISYVGLIERDGTAPEVAASPPAGFAEFRGYIREMEEAEQRCYDSPLIFELAIEWLEDKYRNHWQTSNTGENYYDYWGNYWDSVHDGG